MSSSSHNTAVDTPHQPRRKDSAASEIDSNETHKTSDSPSQTGHIKIQENLEKSKTLDSRDHTSTTHIEHANRPQSPNQAPADLHNHTADEKSIRTRKSRKSQSELDHHQTLTSIRTKIGLEAEAPILEEHDSHEDLTWSSIRVIFREPFAEFFGTFVMILFGNGSVAQVLLSTGQETAPGGNGFGNYQSINWG